MSRKTETRPQESTRCLQPGPHDLPDGSAVVAQHAAAAGNAHARGTNIARAFGDAAKAAASALDSPLPDEQQSAVIEAAFTQALRTRP
jgi:hypothetical protein